MTNYSKFDSVRRERMNNLWRERMNNLYSDEARAGVIFSMASKGLVFMPELSTIAIRHYLSGAWFDGFARASKEVQLKREGDELVTRYYDVFNRASNSIFRGRIEITEEENSRLKRESRWLLNDALKYFEMAVDFRKAKKIAQFAELPEREELYDKFVRLLM